MMTRTEDRQGNGHDVEIGLGYPRLQLAKALRNAWATGDEKAQAKVEKWQQVLEGMFAGQLAVGSRTPIADTPTWVTLEVVTGGFATGNLLAGGDLREHEKALAAELGIPEGKDTRAALNGFFLSEAGQARLAEMIESGRFRIEVPEEGALLVVSWLLKNGDVPQAQALLDQIIPFFDRLRFFPLPSQHDPGGGEQVFLQTAEDTANKLHHVSPQRRLDPQEEAIRIWTPLYDRAVGLLLDTVDGEEPVVELDEAGIPTRSEAGKYNASGGLPGGKKPEGWDEKAQALLREYREQAAKHRLCKRWHRKDEPFQRILNAIDGLSRNDDIPPADRGYLRVALGRYLAKRGRPGSETNLTRREAQKRQCAGPRYHEIARLLASRLDALPNKQGIADISSAQQAISSDEATSAVPADTPVPPHLCRKIGRAKVATVVELIEDGYITSGDVLAEVLPQLTSQIRASSIRDEGLRRVYAHVYRAFRERRSLLLLNLESQVKLEELPWVQAIAGQRQESIADQQLAETVMLDVVKMTLSHFPQAILPNKLLQELRALAKQAGMDMPLVDEVAADIFMGVFSPKFARAAAIAGDLLSGTVYERYYDIDYAQVRGANPQPVRQRAPQQAKRSLLSRIFGDAQPAPERDDGSAKTFSDLCARRAESGPSRGFSVAANGTIIEQQQILTTQNLAVLFDRLDLARTLAPSLTDLVRKTFRWICRRLQIRVAEHHARLVVLKNSAYAWRQLIFYQSFVPADEQRVLVDWMREQLSDQSPEFRDRFKPALDGLAAATKGLPVDSGGGRRFLGWSVGKHWLMPADESKRAVQA